MARRLQFPYICLSICLLVLPLVCSKDEENSGMNDVGELLQKLLKAEKERRTMSDDTNVDGSGGTEQGHTDDNKNRQEIKIEKGPGGADEIIVKVDGKITKKIIQDCENKYELIMDKGDDNAGGECYFHKMDDITYQTNCKGDGNGGKVDIKYEKGPKIEDSTLLSNIKGIDGCMGKPVYELIPTSVQRRDSDLEYEKRLTERRVCIPCINKIVCSWVCAQSSGWWWSHRCHKYEYQCPTICVFNQKCG